MEAVWREEGEVDERGAGTGDVIEQLNSDEEAYDKGGGALVQSAHSSLLDCFNCRHTLQLPLPLPTSVVCDNCGLPLSPPSTQLDTQPAATDSSANEADQLHLLLLLDTCGVCSEAMTGGPLCFLPCGHLIHDRHRLVYRHCTQCKPSLPPYSASDRLHSPSGEESEHYRLRKEWERGRYGEEKGPCFPLFLDPSEVAHLLVYGDEEAAEQSGGRAAMERRTVDLQCEMREKQSEWERQTVEEADKVERVARRQSKLAERQDSLSRRRERTDMKRRRAEEVRMDEYGTGRQCGALERDLGNISQHSDRAASERDREAMRAQDGAAFGTESEADGGGQLLQAESEMRRRVKSAHVGEQLQAVHIRYTHLHNSRIRQIERNEREEESINKQLTASEASIGVLREECSQWASQLAILQCELNAMERQQVGRRKRANVEMNSERADRQQTADTGSSPPLTVPLSAQLNSTSILSTARPSAAALHSRSRSTAAVLSSAAPLRSSSHPPASAFFSSLSPSPAVSASASVSSFPSSASSRRFPSFISPPLTVGRRLSGVDGRGGRVLLTASGGAVQVLSSTHTHTHTHTTVSNKRQATRQHSKRAAAEASRGARGTLDCFIRTAGTAGDRR